MRSLAIALLLALASPAAAQERATRPSHAPQLRLWLQGGAVEDWRGGSGAFGGGLSVGFRERWMTAALGASGTLSGTYQDVAGLGLLGPTVVLGRRERLSVLAAGGWRRTRLANDPLSGAAGAATLPFAGLRIAFDQLEPGGSGFGVFVQGTRDLRSKVSVPGQRWRASALLVGLSFAMGD